MHLFDLPSYTKQMKMFNCYPDLRTSPPPYNGMTDELLDLWALVSLSVT
jgi:hypothetical protein